MSNYAKPLARDKTGQAMTQQVAPFVSLKTYSSENASASSVVTLTPDTTAVEIAAVGAPAVIRWIPTTDTQASVVSAAGGNFDHVIPAASFRRFVVPIEKNNPYPSIQGIGPATGLYARIAWKTIGNASVLATEF